MKSYWFITIILTVYLIPFASVSGQQDVPVRDKYTLLTMPFNKRPVSSYGGQLQVNAGYKFAVRTKSFNSEGEKISLKENGTASILHNYYFEVKYGITDFIEISAVTNYTKNGIRSESASYLSGADAINVNTLNEYKGMSDILVSSAFRLPIEYKWFDLGVKGGISIPVARYQPLEPTHNITDVISQDSYTVNYHFNNTNGYGVPVYQISVMGKFSYFRITLEAGGVFMEPVKDGTSIRWGWTKTGTSFSYYNKPYQYLLSRSLAVNSSIHYQAAGWFDIYLNGLYFKSDGGWTDYWGVRYANPNLSLFSLEPGFEIQISPAITIYQVAGFPLSGKSTDAPFYLFTKLSFNMFPFLR